jgi:hypothetical protein
LPDVPLWDKEKVNCGCEEAVEFVRFLWKEEEKQDRNSAFAPG